MRSNWDMGMVVSLVGVCWWREMKSRRVGWLQAEVVTSVGAAE